MNKFCRCLACVLILLMASPAVAAEVHILAAASLTDAVKDVVAAYQVRHPDTKLLTSFASSGTLARQIAAGAPADIYISANSKWMDYLQSRGLVALETRDVLALNSLVFIGMPGGAVNSLRDLPRLQRIAIGSPKSTPVGQYAMQALEAAELYQRLLNGGKMILAKDARQALMYADRGEVDGAFVYRTDALLTKQAKILFSVPQQLYSKVIYPVALITSALEKDAARKLLAYLMGGESREIFSRYGFVTPK